MYFVKKKNYNKNWFVFVIYGLCDMIKIYFYVQENWLILKQLIYVICIQSDDRFCLGKYQKNIGLGRFLLEFQLVKFLFGGIFVLCREEGETEKGFIVVFGVGVRYLQ